MLSAREQNPAERNRASQRNWYLIAEQPVPVLHLAHPEGFVALRIVLVTVPRVSRSCEQATGSRRLCLTQL